MKNLPILLVLIFGILLSCNTDETIETNLESSEELNVQSNETISNDEFMEEISNNESFLRFVETNSRIEQLITKTIEENQLSPDSFRRMYNDQNEAALETLFKDTDLVELSKQKKEAAKALILAYPDLQNQVESKMSSTNKEGSSTVLFPFLDQNQITSKCSSTSEWALFQVCLALTGLGVTACFVNATLLFGPVGPYLCSLTGSALGAACYANACMSDNGNYLKDVKYSIIQVV